MLKKLLLDLVAHGSVGLGLSKRPVLCPVCNGKAHGIGKVDFNRSCEDQKGRVFERSTKLIDYCLCDRCGFCFAPEFLDWTEQRFLSEIYNDDYALVDPELSELRPSRVAKGLEDVFGGVKSEISHIDYGGGLGILSAILVKNGWTSNSYDPFFLEGSNGNVDTYDLVTAIEVFEHVPQPHRLMEGLISRLRVDGVLFFSTLLSDGVRQEGRLLDWSYLAPRNGHVSLYSTASLTFLLDQYGFKLANVSPGVHVAYRRLPQWCQSLKAFSQLKSN